MLPTLMPFGTTDAFFDFDRMVRRMEDALLSLGPRERTEPRAQLQLAWLPPIEMNQTETEVVLRLEIPGVPKENIHLETTEEGVVIRGERQSQHVCTPGEAYCMSEFTYGTFERRLEWPAQVRYEEAQATYEEGILTVRVPLTEEERGHEPKEIPIG
jgi:HSP20 family protein